MTPVPSRSSRRRNHSEVSDSESSVIGGVYTQTPPPRRRKSSKDSTPAPDYSQADMLGSDEVEDASDESSEPPRAKRRAAKVISESEDEEQETVENMFDIQDGPHDSDLDILDEEEQSQASVNGQEEEASDVEVVDEGIRPEYERDKDGFVKGSIVRLSLVNFMTYSASTFRMGPHLNMILGPNGTGKSSIAAALAIGLGFGPKVMGRAPDLKSYVQQGCEEAQIEVEIKGGRGEGNTVLHCTFERESDRSAWRINGETARKKEVDKIVTGFGVQANNLCCFLPQDKVAEFARLPPEGVLSETMRAAGDPRLSKWHKSLSVEGAKSRATLETLQKETREMEHLKTYVEGMRGEKESFERREQLNLDREIASLTLTVLDSRRAAAALKTAEKERLKLIRKRDTYIRMGQPIMDLSKHQKDRLAKSTRTLERADDDSSRTRKKVEKHISGIVALGDEVEKTYDEIRQVKKRIKRVKEQRDKYTRDLEKAKAKLAEPVEEDLNGKFNVLKQEKRKYADELRACDPDLSEIQDEMKALQSRIERANDDLRRLSTMKDQLSSVEKQREKEARDGDPSLDFALTWIEQNEARFEETIIRPACMSVNVTNDRFVKQLENCTNAAQRKTFIATTEKDFDLLLELSKLPLPRLPNSEGHLRDGAKRVALHFILIKMDGNALAQHRPCSNETATLGFEGFAIDHVQAPDPMMAFLIRCGMARTAITDRSSSQINDNAAIQAGLMSWVCRDDVSQSVRSAYGRRDVQTTTRRANEPKSWLVSLDRAAIQKIGEDMGEIKRQKGEYEKQSSDQKRQYEKLRDKMEKSKEKVDAIQEKMDILRNKRQERLAAEADAKKYTGLLNNDDIADYEEQKARLSAQIKANVQSRLPLLQECIAACDAVFESPGDLVAATLGVAVARENLDLIKDKIGTGLAELDAAKKLIKAHDVEQHKLRLESQKAFDLVKTQLDQASAATKAWMSDQEMHKLQQKNYEEVRDQLEDAEHELSISEGINPDVVEKYEKAEKDLKRTESAVQKASEALQVVQGSINSTLKQFNPALDALIKVVNDKFSQAFALVGCTGEVTLNRSNEDFAKWGIEIAVSYRDGDPLALLTASRQSGGERSLATITYLMSLTEMARTPFSLVDEINQGMDQRAERNVHNQLVQVTNGQHAGQYFLITPKLLTNLDYHEKMRVLTVFNGVHMPSGEVKKGKLRLTDLKAVIRATAKSVQAGRIAVC